MRELVQKLISHLLLMKICYHNAHHLASRIAFFSDHEALGGFYEELDGDYDSLVERTIGLIGSDMANLSLIMSGVMQKIPGCPSTKAANNGDHFKYGLQMETELTMLVEAICKSPECKESTKQLISEIGNKSEMRQYKIKQRIKE